MLFGRSRTHLPLPHVARDMTQIPLIKVIQVPGQPPSVSDWFRLIHGSLIRASLVDFVQTVGSSISSLVATLWAWNYRVTPHLRGELFMRMKQVLKKTKPRHGFLKKPLELFSPMFPEAIYIYIFFTLNIWDTWTCKFSFLLKSVWVVFLSFAEKEFYFPA